MSFFDTKTIKAKLSRLDQLEKTNQQRLKKIQSSSKIKISKDQYLKYKEILFNYSTQKPLSQPSKPAVSDENKNMMNMPKQVAAPQTLSCVDKEFQSPKNTYEFPVQMSTTNSGNSRGLPDSFAETSIKAFDSERPSEKKDHFLDTENVIVLDEMNPNLSFSSCPISENRAQPLRVKQELYQSNKGAIRAEDNLSPGSSRKAKKKVLAYGGEVIEYSDSEEEDSEQASPGFKKVEKKSYNEYRKSSAEKESAREKARFSYKSDKDEDRIQKEFENLLDQKKVLEDEILELRKIQHSTDKAFPFKQKIVQDKISGTEKPILKSSEAIRNSYLDFQKKWEMLESLQPQEERLEMEQLAKDMKDMKEKVEIEPIEQEEEIIQTRRMREDEWRPRKEILETKKKFEKENDFEHEEEYDVEKEDRYRNFNKRRENVLKTKEENGRREILRELVDEITAEIDEVKKNKVNDTPDFKKKRSRLEYDGAQSWRSWGSRESNGRELGSILEQISDAES